MLIDPLTVRDYRTQNCWTQQQLADACQVSLRTIQRVERAGSASNDTVQGLCAVFEIKADDLMPIAQAKEKKIRLSPLGIYLTASTLCGAVIGAFITYYLVS